MVKDISLKKKDISLTMKYITLIITDGKDISLPIKNISED